MTMQADFVRYDYVVKDFDACKGRREYIARDMGLILSDGVTKVFCVVRGSELEVFEMTVRGNGVIEFCGDGGERLFVPYYLPQHITELVPMHAVDLSPDSIQAIISYARSLKGFYSYHDTVLGLLKKERQEMRDAED